MNLTESFLHLMWSSELGTAFWYCSQPNRLLPPIALRWNIRLGHKNICFGSHDQLTCKNYQRDAFVQLHLCAKQSDLSSDKEMPLSFAAFGLTFVCVLCFPIVLVCLPLLSCPWHSSIFCSLFRPCWEVLAEVKVDSIFLHLHKLVIKFLVIKVGSK